MLSGVRALLRSGALTPSIPRLRLLEVLATLPFRSLNLGVAVGVQAGLRPDDEALIDEAGALTWRALDERVSRLAHAVSERAPAGSRIAFLVRNGREAVECYTGIGRGGRVAVPLNTWSSAEDVRRVREAQQPALVVADPEFADLLAGAGVNEVLWTGPDGTYEQALDAVSARAPSIRGNGRIVTQTSGTTGAPKGAERDMRGRPGVLLELLEKVPLRRGDRFLIAPPLFHMLALGMMGATMAVGGTMVLRRRFDPDDFVQTMARERVAAACLVPAMVQGLCTVEDRQSTPDWRIAVVSGSAFPPAMRERAEARFGRIFYDLWGSTEVGWATISTPADQARKPGSVGTPGRGMRVFAADEDGRVLPPGEIGRLYADTGAGFEGYTGTRSDRRAIGDAIEFGDLGYVDEDGYVFVTGRADDMIVSGGENIYPSEVEAALVEHPAVEDAVVVGVEDEAFGQVLHAHVTAVGEPVTEVELIEFLRGKVARYKVPKEVHLHDELPRNALGKVLKRELR